MNILYVYGTLRPNNPAIQVQVPGLLYDLGWYPGLKLEAPSSASRSVVAERVLVTDEELQSIDRYEGYHESDPHRSLFRRVPYLDGEIYTYNHSLEGREPINTSGVADWFVHKKLVGAGSAADMVGIRNFAITQGHNQSDHLPNPGDENLKEIAA